MEEVHRRTGEAHEREIARHHRLLGEGGLAGDPEPARPGAFVHRSPGRELLVLAMLGEHEPEVGRVLEGAAHEAGVLHTVTVVGEQMHAELGHLTDRRRAALASAPDGDRAGDRHLDDELRLVRRCRTWSRTIEGESIAGSVFGIATIAL